MSSKDTVPDAVGNVLRDLEPLLRKTIGKEVKVIEFKTSSLLPKGENYGSEMLKLDVLIKKTKNSPEEKLYLVAKMNATTEFQRAHLIAKYSFGKEIFIFERLASVYKELESEAGINDMIDIFPKFYGGRLSRDENSDEADDDVVLLLENLNVLGYDTMSRMQGLDLDYAKSAIIQLARYHALGIAVKHKRPEFFAEAEKVINVLPFKIDSNEFEGMLDHTVKTICEDKRTAQYEDRIRASFETNNWETMMYVEKIEPWVTITHGDFWVNNVMFKQGPGQFNDLKLIDFQLARTCSPVNDLPYFLCSSTNPQVLENHFDELLDLYHGKFIEMLKRHGCETSCYSRDKFDKELAKVANRELFHCIMALKFFTLEVTEDTDLSDLTSAIMMAGSNNLYLERSWNIISKFVQKGWL